MDSVLIISEQPQHYVSFLERLGYFTLTETPQDERGTLLALFDERVIDLVLLDGITVTDYSEIIVYLRDQE